MFYTTRVSLLAANGWRQVPGGFMMLVSFSFVCYSGRGNVMIYCPPAWHLAFVMVRNWLQEYQSDLFVKAFFKDPNQCR